MTTTSLCLSSKTDEASRRASIHYIDAQASELDEMAPKRAGNPAHTAGHRARAYDKNTLAIASAAPNGGTITDGCARSKLAMFARLLSPFISSRHYRRLTVSRAMEFPTLTAATMSMVPATASNRGSRGGDRPCCSFTLSNHNDAIDTQGIR